MSLGKDNLKLEFFLENLLAADDLIIYGNYVLSISTNQHLQWLFPFSAICLHG
jgi:hypothetical protein